MHLAPRAQVGEPLMAAPVVDSVTPGTSVSLPPGTWVDVTIAAHDPNSASGAVNIPLTDGQGNALNVGIAVTVEDPLTFGAASVVDLPGVTVARLTPAGVSPATYRITAAA